MADQPLLKLLSKALELWLRQQCEVVQCLEIELLGSGRELLRGRLAGVRVQARGVTYQQLELALVDLRVGDLQLQLGQLWRGQPLQLPLEIAITGLVGLTPEALSRSLLQPQWQALADELAEQLLGVSPLVGLRIRDQHLVFQAQGVGSSTPLELETTLLAEDGGVRISASAGGNDALLPMGPAITVERAAIEAGLVVLEGSATVITA
ncbi:MAG: DUF2993 domain-containing protein [Cyanobium sp.]